MRGLIPAAASRARRGFTLVEVIIVLVIFGIVGGVITRVILRQQRFYQGVNQIMTNRSQLRQAISVLPVDLRSLSSIGDDVLAVSDSGIEIQMHVASGIMCQRNGGDEITLPPLTLANGQTLTSFTQRPAFGDVMYVYNDSSAVGNGDDRWQMFEVLDVLNSTTRCLGPSFVNVALDAGKTRTVLRVSSTEPNDPVTFGPISQYITVGAPVRIVRRARYALFQDTDSKWYLGFAEWDKATNSYNALAAVSGPYEPYVSGAGAASGLGFRYYDNSGTEIASGAAQADRRRIARIDLVARGRTEMNVRADGIQGGANRQYSDSLRVTVMLRNRT